MIKNKTHLEIKIGERSYELVCDNDAPLGELHDAVQTIKNFIIEKINQFNQQIAEKPAEEKVNDS